MKSYTKVLVILLAILLVSGCGSKSGKEKKALSCDLVITDPADKYKVVGKYDVYTKGDSDVVTKVETTETVTSKTKDILDEYENTLNSQYSAMEKNYGGYDYKVTRDDEKVEAVVKIDYTKLDIKKLVENNTAMKSYLNDDNEILLKGIKSSYESLGAICK